MTTSQLQDHLYNLEERLFHPDRETDRTALVPFLAEEYKEFCSTGRIYNREHVVKGLLTGDQRPTTIHNYYVTSLGRNAALATYRASTANATTYRSSIWVFRDNSWQLLFHQSTTAA